MELCCVVARHAPMYGIGILLPDMLSIEVSGWDALMIGLRALLTMLIAAPAWSKGDQQPSFEVHRLLSGIADASAKYVSMCAQDYLVCEQQWS